jgi:hypothetical protein
MITRIGRDGIGKQRDGARPGIAMHRIPAGGTARRGSEHPSPACFVTFGHGRWTWDTEIGIPKQNPKLYRPTVRTARAAALLARGTDPDRVLVRARWGACRPRPAACVQRQRGAPRCAAPIDSSGSHVRLRPCLRPPRHAPELRARRRPPSAIDRAHLRPWIHQRFVHAPSGRPPGLA